ncbi:MAG: hypothetical protein H0T84_08515 [Tatlockia sp.]|nr:hypothetical protein [Tatlockia sp.]
MISLTAVMALATALAFTAVTTATAFAFTFAAVATTVAAIGHIEFLTRGVVIRSSGGI